MKHLNISTRYIIILVFAVVIAYINNLWNGFAYDDISVIAENKYLGDASNVKDLFSPRYFKVSGEQSYRPLVTFSYMVGHRIWAKNPAGYHFINTLFHLLTVLTLFMLGIQLTGSKMAAFWAALLMACHPLMTEAVCSITFGEDVMCTFFFLYSLSLYIKFRQSESIWLIPVIGTSYLFSLAAKEMAFAFVPLIGLYELLYYKKPRSLPFWITALASIVIVAVFFALARFVWLRHPAGDDFDTVQFSVITMIESFLTYLRLYFFPYGLQALYYHTHLLKKWHDILLAVIAVGIMIYALVKLRPLKQSLFLIGATLICLGPVMNIYPVRHLAAERYTYLPAFGVFLFIAVAFETAVILFPSKVVLPTVLLVIFLFISGTVTRNAVWKDNYTLWLNTTRSNPYLAEANYSLAHAYQSKGEIDKAIVMYKRAIDRRENYFDAYINLGRAYVEKGLQREGINVYLTALKIKPNSFVVHYNLGIAYDHVGDDEKSLYHLNRAKELEPSNPAVCSALGAFYIMRDDASKAEYYWLEAIQVDPAYIQGYVNLGSLYANQKNFKKALYFWHKALEIDPAYEPVLNKLRLLKREEQLNTEEKTR
ncbi:MAG: tetratricopeptide repeat protein [Candidatus Auribacterota bacterium]